MEKHISEDTVLYEADKEESKHVVSSALEKRYPQGQITPIKTKA